MNITITDTTFSGGNEDGTPPLDPGYTQLKMQKWYCIGPVYYGKPRWRERLAWLLLGHKVTIRQSNIKIVGSPENKNNNLQVIKGGKP